MIATRPTTMTSPALPQTLDAFVGNALELVIHSVESMRDRLSRALTRRRD